MMISVEWLPLESIEREMKKERLGVDIVFRALVGY